MTEDEILRQGVHVKHGATPTMYGIALEQELARIYMDDGRLARVTENTPEDEIMAWGKQFKTLATDAFDAKEREMRAAGEI